MDAAEDNMAKENSLQLREAEESELRSVEAALIRVFRADYGRCMVCDGSIAFERLSALPNAERCIRCQREADKMNQRGSGEQENWGMLAHNEEGLSEHTLEMEETLSHVE